MLDVVPASVNYVCGNVLYVRDDKIVLSTTETRCKKLH